MNHYKFDDCLIVGHSGESILDAYFHKEYLIVHATPDHQRNQKIDRFLIKRNDGMIIHKVDYKTDRAAADYGNLALEHISVYRNGVVEQRGWIHTTIADLLIHYVPAWDKGFVMKTERLRAYWDDILRLFPPKKTGTFRNGQVQYESHCCCARVDWLKNGGFIHEEFCVGQQQLSF